MEVWGNDVDQLLAACRHADEVGIDLFAYGESPHDLNLECWTVLAALAAATEQIRLGPVIANVIPEFRSAFLLARQAETLDTIAPGRIELRTGVGAATPHARPWWEPHGIHYPDYEQRLADLEAALELWADRASNRGSCVPVTVAATGDRALALAARHAEVWETSFCTPDQYVERRRRFETALAASPAPDRRVVRCLEIDGFVGTTSEAVDRVLASARADRGPTEDLDAIFVRALVGAPDRVADHLGRLAEVGVDRVLVALHDPLDLDAITALAQAR